MEQQSNYIGIDLSKAGIDVAVRPESIAWQRIASTKTCPPGAEERHTQDKWFP